MNGAHVHLLLNHVPILGSLFALCLLLYGIFSKSEAVIKAALLTLVVSTLIAIPAFLSGEEAEHLVEPILGINENAMEEHEDMAEIAFWSMVMAGAVALGTLVAIRSTKFVSMMLLWVNVVMLAIVFVLMARAGLSGGEIRHTEINVTATTSDEESHED
ncbi:MAG: hypothetical protein M3Q95_05395 [Bacteroidota bacterium]|nr:hypothetical protein [Bacteroidota bacterium]